MTKKSLQGWCFTAIIVGALTYAAGSILTIVPVMAVAVVVTVGGLVGAFLTEKEPRE